LTPCPHPELTIDFAKRERRCVDCGELLEWFDEDELEEARAFSYPTVLVAALIAMVAGGVIVGLLLR